MRDHHDDQRGTRRLTSPCHLTLRQTRQFRPYLESSPYARVQTARTLDRAANVQSRLPQAVSSSGYWRHETTTEHRHAEVTSTRDPLSPAPRNSSPESGLAITSPFKTILATLDPLIVQQDSPTATSTSESLMNRETDTSRLVSTIRCGSHSVLSALVRHDRPPVLNATNC